MISEDSTGIKRQSNILAKGLIKCSHTFLKINICEHYNHLSEYGAVQTVKFLIKKKLIL